VVQVSRRGGSPAAAKGSLKDLGGDVAQVVIDYAKQETLGPLQGLARFMLFGVSGSIVLTVGLILLLVGLLRALQTETGSALTGNLSWVPYACVAVVALAVMALAVWRVARGPAARRRPPAGANVDSKEGTR
jgi:predicted cobalt transporter CbtA